MSQTELMLFEVETATGSDGREERKVKRVVRECSVKKAAKILEVSEKTVRRYFEAGLLEGWQPGLALAMQKRRKGGADHVKKKPNVKIVLSWDSVMAFREVEKAKQVLARELF